MERQISNRFAAFFALCVLTQAGCQSFETPSWDLPFIGGRSDESSPEMKNVKPPHKVVALWTDTTFTTPGKPPTRGLGGRLYFYDEDRKPVPVAGTLIVYGYDDSQASPSKREPDRKYIFKSDKLASHYSETEFGPSYSIWIPWDAVGASQIEISALPVLTTTTGVVVMGDLTRHVLPGPKTEPAAESARRPAAHSNDPANAGVQLMGFQSNPDTPVLTARNGDVRTSNHVEMATISTPTVNPNDQLRATSIRLPPAVSQRLIHSTPMRVRQQLSAPGYHANQPVQYARPETAAPESSVMTPRDSVPTQPMWQGTAPAQAPARPAGMAAAARRPLTRYGLPRHQAPNLPARQPVFAPPQTQPYPVTAPSVPAWQPGYSPVNSP